MFSNDTFDLESLDDVFNRMLDTIMSSKDDIFIISEQSRLSFEDMQKELEIVRKQISVVIDEGDALEKKYAACKAKTCVSE